MLKASAASVALIFSVCVCSAQRIEVTVPSSKPLNGHLVLVISKTDTPEPRNQLTETYDSAQGFGVDAENLSAGTPLVIDAKTFGYPRRSLANLDAGDYYVQGVFNVYEQFHLASGKTVWLPPDKGEGQHWFAKPGNAFNKPQKIHFDPKSSSAIKLTLDQIIPPIEGTSRDPLVVSQQQPTAKWLKYERLKSQKLSTFWGRDMYLNAWVLLPDGFDEHPDAKYPLIVYQDHFHVGIGPAQFTAVPPTDSKSPDFRRQLIGHRLYQDWISGRLPRVILIYVQNANPYYDDSYDVDSANVGPYGSAINDELIPMLESKYRGIGQGWARATFGGSTGGWEALATQVFYPDFYNGAFVACPDPVDFHAYQNVDLYNDANAFVRKSDFGEMAIPGDRKTDGAITATTAGSYAYELVLGTRGRSTEQWDIWQAVYSPAGDDGYPAQIIDPQTGAIDKKVLAYWHDHYDLAAIMKRDWSTLGPKLEGKLHITVGDADTFFLNNAVHMLEKQLQGYTYPAF